MKRKKEKRKRKGYILFYLFSWRGLDGTGLDGTYDFSSSIQHGWERQAAEKLKVHGDLLIGKKMEGNDSWLFRVHRMSAYNIVNTHQISITISGPIFSKYANRA